MPVLVGTSGWQYRDWRGSFYPEKGPQSAWLEHYAERFATVEVNNAFYRLPEPATFAAWAARTPADFVVGVKMSRYLTHIKRLKNPEEPVERFVRHASNLGAKLGPVLLQLPPNLKADFAALERTLARFPADWRLAVEVRHPSWLTGELRDVLTRHGAAFCLADRKNERTPLWRTADWGYLRLHEGTATPRPCYGDGALRSWAERVTECWSDAEDVYVYFNNDPNACAVANARTFAHAVERLGRVVTRVPGRGDVHVVGA